MALFTSLLGKSGDLELVVVEMGKDPQFCIATSDTFSVLFIQHLLSCADIDSKMASRIAEELVVGWFLVFLCVLCTFTILVYLYRYYRYRYLPAIHKRTPKLVLLINVGLVRAIWLLGQLYSPTRTEAGTAIYWPAQRMVFFGRVARAWCISYDRYSTLLGRCSRYGPHLNTPFVYCTVRGVIPFLVVDCTIPIRTRPSQHSSANLCVLVLSVVSVVSTQKNRKR